MLKKKKKETERNIQELWGNFKRCSIHIYTTIRITMDLLSEITKATRRERSEILRKRKPAPT